MPFLSPCSNCAATPPGRSRTQPEFLPLRSVQISVSKPRTRTHQDAPEKPLVPLHGGGQGFESLGSNLLTRLCLFWLAREDEMGISLGYGKHFDSLKACCTEPPSVLLLGVGVSKLRIDHHVHTKQSGSLA